jgi:asparagine synthase (glutamine-hydrolysing)
VLADRIAAGVSADMRHPFFDRRVIDLLLSFPDEVRSAAPPPKALLRRAMGASLPAVVRDRSSAAEFSVLVRKALVEPHGERLAAMVRTGRLADAGLIDGAAAAAAIHRARTEDDTIREVMMLAWLEMWLRALDP